LAKAGCGAATTRVPYQGGDGLMAGGAVLVKVLENK